MKDEEKASVLGGADEILVIKAGVPKRLEISLLPHFGLSGDCWVLFLKGGIVLVERCHYPRFVLVGRVGEYKAGKFAGFRTGEAD